MELTKKVPTTDKNQENNHLLRMLDRGIDDMEAGRELQNHRIKGCTKKCKNIKLF